MTCDQCNIELESDQVISFTNERDEQKIACAGCKNIYDNIISLKNGHI